MNADGKVRHLTVAATKEHRSRRLITCDWPELNDNPMEDLHALKQRLKKLMVENLMLQVSAEEIGDDQPLFGPASLGLDSVDALQLVVALDKNFGLKVADPAAAREILHSVNTMAAAVQRHGGSAA